MMSKHPLIGKVELLAVPLHNRLYCITAQLDPNTTRQAWVYGFRQWERVNVDIILNCSNADLKKALMQPAAVAYNGKGVADTNTNPNP